MTKTILTGVDNSETARRAAESAAALASAFGAALHVVSAFSVNMTEAFHSVQGDNQSTDRVNAYEKLKTKYTQDAERTASRVADDLRIGFPELKILSKAVQGAPGVALINEAEQIEADVIVVGNKRVQGPTRILGSIARTVASEANCDLYVVNTHAR